jgi:hypothetical protein
MPPTRPAKTMVRIGHTIKPAPDCRPGPWISTDLVAYRQRDLDAEERADRLSTADNPTATFGIRAPVAMEVAIALPVSWKPLVKSKASAVRTTTIKMNNASVTYEWIGQREG